MTQPDGLVALTLVPVAVFGTDDCCTHGLSADPAECPSTGHGLADAVEAWSDCNRAVGQVYRVDDSEGHRQPGDAVQVWVRPEDAAWFERQFGAQ